MEHVYKIKRILTNQELKKKKIMKISKSPIATAFN